MMNQHSSEMTYNIQQVSEITGLSKLVIRKWEERYGIVNPKRLDNGYRVYSPGEVNVLLYVKSLVEKGHTLKQAAMHVKNHSIPEAAAPDKKAEDTAESNMMNKYTASLLYEGALCKEANINKILQQAYHAYDLRTFLNSIITPFLKEAEQRRSDGRWGEHQEALAGLAVRDFLIQIRRNYPFNESAPLLLGACLPFERYEIPLHIILLECILSGWRTTMLGPSCSLHALQAAIEQLNPKKVILSAETAIPPGQNPGMLQELDEFASQNPHIHFYISGFGAIEYTQYNPLRSIKVVGSASEILQDT